MGFKKLQKILVPLDGSKTSLRGLNLAIILAKSTGSDIIGLNIFSFPLFFPISSDVKNKIRKKSEEIIKQAELLSRKENVSFRGVNKIGDNVGKAIISFSDDNMIDMIIIGSRGPDPEADMFLGSVANYVINKSKIPVTVVK